MMKTFRLLGFIFLLSCFSSQAQINLVGAGINSATNSIDIVKWQALDSSSVTYTPTILQGYLFNSSVFDAYNSNYYITGITATSNGLLAFNTVTNESSLSPYTTFSNISEIDMSTGKIYNLTSGAPGYITVNEYDISIGTDSVLGVIYEPGIQGIITDATGFDSNNGILYYVGYDNSPSSCLYSIPVRNPVFSFTKTTLLTTAPVNNFSSVNYDNANNLLFASNAEYDSAFTYLGNRVVELNPITGEVISRGMLTGFPYYLAGSSSFDQNSGSFLLVAFDANFVQKMIVFDTYTNTFTTGFVPGNVSEIVCDNFAFAQSKYGIVSVNEKEKLDVTISPNPATTQFTIRVKGPAEACTVTIYNAQGKSCYSGEMHDSTTEISTGSLSKGVYFVTLQNKTNRQTQKLIVE